LAPFLDEAHVEIALVESFERLGYEYAFGPGIAWGGARPARTSYADVVLDGRLRWTFVRVAEVRSPILFP
jgi:type I restriction enzyme R subunit